MWVTIAYNRPERMNAINGQMREALNAAWLRFRDDEDAWVAILTGSGRAFCAGADIREGGGPPGRLPARIGKSRRLIHLRVVSNSSNQRLLPLMARVWDMRSRRCHFATS